MAVAVSTLGVKLGYQVTSETGGARPSSGTYTDIPGIKSISGLSGEPSTLDATPLSETRKRRSILGLQDASIATIVANNTDTFQTTWATLRSAATASGVTNTWFEVKVPGLAKSFYFAGTPAAFETMDDVEVDTVVDATVYIPIEDLDGWA